jgi:hypothetical protein
MEELRMSETELLESTISEYMCLVSPSVRSRHEGLDRERLVHDLRSAHDWTDGGARVIVSLAHDYGAFLLRNALALAIALDKEDGDRGF